MRLIGTREMTASLNYQFFMTTSSIKGGPCSLILMAIHPAVVACMQHERYTTENTTLS